MLTTVPHSPPVHSVVSRGVDDVRHTHCVFQSVTLLLIVSVVHVKPVLQCLAIRHTFVRISCHTQGTTTEGSPPVSFVSFTVVFCPVKLSPR